MLQDTILHHVLCMPPIEAYKFKSRINLITAHFPAPMHCILKYAQCHQAVLQEATTS